MKNIEIGDIVKSLDFVSSDDCYYVGKVVGVFHDGTFRAKVMERVWLGKADNKFPSDFFTAPLPGHHFADDLMFPRVQVIG